MKTTLFTSSVPLVLCEWDSEKNSLVDTETVTIQNLTIEGLAYLNSYIRRTYLTMQKDAVKEWSKEEADNFLKIAQKQLHKFSAGTRKGNEILFNSADGMLRYTWMFVKHRFKTIGNWKTHLRSNGAVYQKTMERFNNAIVDLARLTAQELNEQ
jgi:hypothetical protein